MTPDWDDRGTTLAELVVAMLVFGVFGTFLATSVLQTTRLTRDSAVRERTAQAASTAMAQITRDLRTALRVGPPAGEQVAFVTATATEVTFYSAVEPAPVRERLFLQGTAVQREVKVPDTGSAYPNLLYTSTDPSRTTTGRLAPGLETTLTFGYLLRDSATELATIEASRLKDITAVSVRLSVDGDGSGPLKPVVLRNTVRPYNP